MTKYRAFISECEETPEIVGTTYQNQAHNTDSFLDSFRSYLSGEGLAMDEVEYTYEIWIEGLGEDGLGEWVQGEWH